MSPLHYNREIAEGNSNITRENITVGREVPKVLL